MTLPAGRDAERHSSPRLAASNRQGATLASGVLRLLVGRFASLSMTFVAWALAARALEPDRFGFLQVAIAVTFYLSFATDAGLSTLGTREVASSRNRDHLVRQIFGTRLAIGVALTAATTLVVAIAVRHDDRAVWIVLASTIVAASANAVWVLRAMNRSAALAVIDVVAAAAFLAGVVVAVRSPSDVATAALVYAFSQWIAAALSVRYVGRPDWIRPMLRGSKTVLRRSAPLAVAILAINVYYSADSILLGLLRTSTEVGYYAAAYKLVLPWLLIASIVGLLAMPRLAADLAENRDVLETVERLARLLFALGLSVAVAGTLLAESLVIAVFGPAYRPAIVPLVILIWSVVTVLANASFGFYMLARRDDRRYMWIAVAGAVLNLGLNVVLIPDFGMVGAGVATLAAEVLVLSSILWATRHVSLSTVPRAAAGAVVVAGLTGLAVLPIRDSLVAIATGTAAFAAALLLTKSVRLAEIRAVIVDATGRTRR